MKFTPDVHIDAVKASMKLKYDEIFAQIHDAKDDPALLRKLQMKEKRLNERTKRFINKHKTYFSNKRKWHFDKMENAEMFGEKPKTDQTYNSGKMSRGMVV
jgi:hypothetical protein